MPTPEELAALLALPLAAREALARCEGPGWACSPLGACAIFTRDGWSVAPGCAWLPCDTAAILDVAGNGWALYRSSAGFAAVRVGDESTYAGPDCATPRLAALRLLAAVS